MRDTNFGLSLAFCACCVLIIVLAIYILYVKPVDQPGPMAYPDLSPEKPAFVGKCPQCIHCHRGEKDGKLQ